MSRLKLSEIFNSITKDLKASVKDDNDQAVVSLDEIEMELDLSNTIEIDGLSFYTGFNTDGSSQERSEAITLKVINPQEKEFRRQQGINNSYFRVKVLYTRLDDENNVSS